MASLRRWMVGCGAAAAVSMGLPSMIVGAAPVASSAAAPDGPGALSHFDLARKDCVGTARNTSSKVWYTVANGVLSDVYYPTVDNTNVETLQYIVTDGATFTDLQTRDMTSSAKALDAGGMVCEVTSTATNGRYRIVTDYFTDPGRNTLLMNVQLVPTGPGANALQLYVRFDPTVNGNGGGGAGNGGKDSAVTDVSKGHPIAVASDTDHRHQRRQPGLRAAGVLGARRPVLAGDQRLRRWRQRRVDPARHRARSLTSTFDSAADGNVVQVAQLNLGPGAGKAVLALGFGATQAAAVGAAEASLTAKVQQVQKSYEAGWSAYDASLKPPPKKLAGLAEQPRRRAPARVLPERQHRQGVRGQDLPRRHRRRPRLAVGSGRVGRRSEQHLLRLVPRGVRPRPLRGLDRSHGRRRHRHRTGRDAVPLQPAAARRRLHAPQQPRERQDRTGLVRHAARRDGVPAGDGRRARPEHRLALQRPHQAGRELRRRARPLLRGRAVGGAVGLLALDHRGGDRRTGRGRAPRGRQPRRGLGPGLAGRRRRHAAFGQVVDRHDERAGRRPPLLHPALQDRRSRTPPSPTTSATAGPPSTSARSSTPASSS